MSGLATTFALLLLIGETLVALAAEPTAESATSANGAGTNALRYSNKWRIEVGEGAQIQTARSVGDGTSENRVARKIKRAFGVTPAYWIDVKRSSSNTRTRVVL